jgi:hypothetical protein
MLWVLPSLCITGPEPQAWRCWTSCSAHCASVATFSSYFGNASISFLVALIEKSSSFLP